MVRPMLRHRATRGHRFPGDGADRSGYRWAGRGHCRRWSRHGQRDSWRGRGHGGGADRHGLRRAGSGPLAPHRLTAARTVTSARTMSNPAASFEPYRRRLLGLAYRMLGSMADAEDAVQETYLRWHASDRDNVSDPRAFLMTTTTRICLDMLTSALTPRANVPVRGGARTSGCALRPSTACRVSSWTAARDPCRRPRSRLRAT